MLRSKRIIRSPARATSELRNWGRDLVLLGLVFITLSGCSESEDSLWGQSLGPLTVEELPAYTDVRPLEWSWLAQTEVGSGVVGAGDFLQAFVLNDGGLVGQTSQGLRYRLPGQVEWREAGLGPRWLTGATHLPDGKILVAGTQGIGTLGEEGYTPSPLQETIDGRLITGLFWTGEALWVVTQDAVFRWADNTLAALEWPGLPSQELSSKRGRCEGEEGLWFWTPELAYCVQTATSEWSGFVQAEGVIDGLVLREASPPLLLSRHVLYEDRGAQGWVKRGVESRVLEVVAGTGEATDVFWLRTETGWIQGQGDSLRPVSEMPAFLEPVGLGTGGALIGLADGAWVRLTPGFLLSAEGLEAGAIVYEDTWVSFVVEGDVSPEEWFFTLDGVEITGDGNGVWVVVEDLDVGPHVLVAEASFGAELPLSIFEIAFERRPVPTWEDAIEPLYQSKCALCHEPSVTTFPLHTMDLWVDNITDITLAVELGVMPLLPKELLTADELEAVHAWTQLGFPE